MCSQVWLLTASAASSFVAVALMIAALVEPWYTVNATIPGPTPAGTSTTLEFLVSSVYDPTSTLSSNGVLPYSSPSQTDGFCNYGYLAVCPTADFATAALGAATLGSAAIGIGVVGLLFELASGALAVLGVRNRMLAAKPSRSLQAATLLSAFVAVLMIAAGAGLAGTAAGSAGMAGAWKTMIGLAEANAPQLSFAAALPGASMGLGVGAVLLAAGATALDVLVFCCVRTNVREERGTRAGGGNRSRGGGGGGGAAIVVNPVPVRSASYRAPPEEERASFKPSPASSKNRPSASKTARV